MNASRRDTATWRRWSREALVVCAALLFSSGAATAAEGRLKTRIGEDGVSSLEWAGIELSGGGSPGITHVLLEKVTRDAKGECSYSFERVPDGEPKSTYDAASNRLTQRYTWGTLQIAFKPNADRLDIAATITNSSKRTIADFEMNLMALTMPTLPMGSDKYSARWTGTVKPRHSESYTFYTKTDDGTRLWVDGRLLIDKWVNQAPTEYSGSIDLEAGRAYDIKMEYFENSGGAAAQLSWSSPSQQKELIPPSQLDNGSGEKGLKGEYFADMELSRLHLTRTDPQVDFSWGNGSPEASSGLGSGGAMLSSLDNPAIIQTAFGPEGGGASARPTEKLALCCITMDPPMHFGLANARNDGHTFDFVIKGGVLAPAPGGVEVKPHGRPRVPPGKDLTLEFSIRFGGEKTDPDEMIADVYEAFREHTGAPLDWPDRRVIAMMMLSSSWEGHKSATNPRGWYNEKTIDVMSPAGKADFRKRTLERAHSSVKILKRIDAQGVIVWDIEGQENPHPISFIGDPRLAKTMAPEMDEVADEFFKVFLDAGIRTGICIRPTQPYFDPDKKQWDHGTGSHCPDRNPHDESFDEHWPKGLPWWRFFPVAQRLIRKITYAKERWGCTIFYIDTNGTYRPVGEGSEFKWMLLSHDIIKQVRKAHPDVLIVPELVGNKTAYWSQTAPYFELDLGGVSTPEHVRKIFPKAFSVLNMVDGPFAERREELVAAVRRGDLLMTYGWWDPERNNEVKSVYDEVHGTEAAGPGAGANFVKAAAPVAEGPARVEELLAEDGDTPALDTLLAETKIEQKPVEPPSVTTTEEARPDPVVSARAAKPADSTTTYVVAGIAALVLVVGAVMLASRGKPRRNVRRSTPRNGTKRKRH